MRVLHILGELRASGAEVMLRDAVPLFRPAGIEPVMLSTGEEVGDFAAQYRQIGVEVCHLPFERKLSYLAALRRLIRDREIDVVHVHTERANAVLGVTARCAGTRVVRTIHSVFSYQGLLRLTRTFERSVLRALGVKHIAIGASVQVNELQRLGNRTIRIDNWIGPGFRPPAAEERASAREALGLATDAIAMTTIGNCSDVKNHEAVLRALPLIRAQVGCPLVYLHAGHGSSEAQERRLAETMAEGSTEVRFLGTISDVRPLLWATDIYCMPSLYEGVGNAALEALACGVPSVLADVPGLRDISAPEAGIRFVEPTAAGIAEGTATILEDPAVARASTEQVAERVRAERSAEKSVGKMVQIYRST
jgi:glycosyltransferase involved in cell wall biosynthesis